MFTGLIEQTAEVAGIQRQSASIRLTLTTRNFKSPPKIGDSIAVNGCCLTLVEKSRVASRLRLEFDLLEETWRLTNFQDLSTGSTVNLERALRGDGHLGGHFVTGHVDGLCQISRWEKSGTDYRLEIRVPRRFLPQLVRKGSIAVDGISLTIADIVRDRVGIWIIPHTFEVTNLKHRRAGERVNIETDMLGKYVIQFLEKIPGRRTAARPG